ncbi:MAG: prolipoprotein diacylglyceryl transferase [Acidobacteria bacterium]|nr:prolipoprotein diacylglyceryl transferase [Acidobacteriota bacterium]
MFPELFRIPGINFTVNTYGVLLATSFLLGLWLAATLGSREGYDKNKIYDIGLYMLLGELVGSKLLLVITEWHEFAQNPKLLFQLDFIRSAGVFYGGFLGSISVSFFMANRYKIPWWTLADICAPGIALGQFTGRLGCFSAGCCWGKPTSYWIGVRFTEQAHKLTGVPIDVHLHPVQLYESGVMFFVTLFLLYLLKIRKFRGQVILSYLFIYAIARFSIEFFRDDPRGGLLGLSTSQLIAGTIAPIALVAFIYKFWQWKKDPQPLNPNLKVSYPESESKLETER